MSENTPFRDDPDSGDQYEEEQTLPEAPASSHFKGPLRVLALLNSLFSFLCFGLLVAIYVLCVVWDFATAYRQTECIRDIGICLLVNTVLSIGTIFIPIHILINMIIHAIMSVVIFSFSAVIFNEGWPGRYMCLRWKDGGGYTQSPQCLKHKGIIQIMMGVSGGCAIFISVLMVLMILIRTVALYRTRFWVRWGKFSDLSIFKGWRNSTGFTLQFSMSILPAGTLPVVVDTQRSRDVEDSSVAEQERLIET